MKDKSLYFIALIPPEPLRNRIVELKLKFAEKYQTNHALKSPPHITLIPPFNFRNEEEKRIIELLEIFTQTANPFNVTIKGFGTFKPKVIYLDFTENELLNSFQMRLSKEFKDISGLNLKKGKLFAPHMTLAFRDLSPQMFYRAWEKYKLETFEASFMVKSLFLLKHNGKCWDIAYELLFP